MANALVSLQVIPRPPDNEDVIPLVDRAIAVIADSGVKFRVGPLETTMEGELSHLLDIVREVSDQMVELGCPSVISQVKIFHTPAGASMDRLTEKYDH
ncbi:MULTISPECIES: MTH1187 family thiamine-binding protein [unclassified Wenzhouxiangella]|uniref:thiamine-binding protein n=1 Tax=unclassified Wenzhouxiangella TaxID=2613841 RepID=UPI000E32D281|nr:MULTISPECIES: MTH1187 family thiamine-binding protein [unclassified Wenzhouxiangella]RFF27257.1 thiamine-binding protein [Wenzhouxiangella sp. 15181]RFP69285.1 thiamine-binding protein [Wenzhouxiangella sp. 15190]